MKLRLTLDGEYKGEVDRAHYVKAKTKQLREFGYTDLTEKTVDEQVTAVLEGKELMEGMTVIGGFIKGEIAPVSVCSGCGVSIPPGRTYCGQCERDE